MEQFLDSGEVAALIGASHRKDVYLLVKFGILAQFGDEQRYRFCAATIARYMARVFDDSGIPKAELARRCVGLRRLGYSMEMIMEITHLPLTWVRIVLEIRGMGRGYRAGRNGAYKSNRFEVGRIDQARVIEMRRGGRTLHEIGRAFRVSYVTIKNILDKNMATG